jgi:hypothetical protein
MSQTLQALNSIIKYKNERERQKIDRSLAMMDMATRLRQQKIDNARQERMMQLRENQETRQVEKAELDAIYLNKKINALDKADTQQKSELQIQTNELELQKLQAEVDKARAIADREQNKNVEKIEDDLKAGIDNEIRSQKEIVYQSFQRSLPGLMDAINKGTMDNEFSLAESTQVINSLSKIGETKQEKKLYEYIGNKYGQFLIPAIAGFQLSGGKDYDTLTNGLSRFYLDVMDNNKMQNLYQNAFGKESDVVFQNDLNKLSNIIERESTLESYKNSGDITKDALKYAKLQGKDRNAFLDQYIGNILQPYIGDFTQEDIDEINRRRAEAGEEEIPAGEFE